MFEHHGAERTTRQNVILAGYLATVAGFVDAVGVVVLDRYTSHVTGTVVRTTAALAQHAAHPLGGLGMLTTFFVGALLSSSLLESSHFSRPANAYGVVLSLELTLLLGAALGPAAWLSPRLFALCCAMGLQNALVTRLSGAVVRTTHLTGVVTDLGIEVSRWLRYTRLRRRGVSEPPPAAKIQLLGAIALAFVVGASLGAFSAVAWHERSLLLPSLGVGVGAAVAFWRARRSAP